MNGGRTSQKSSRHSRNGSDGPRRHRPDYQLVVLSIVLAAVGSIVIYSLSPAIGALSGESPNFYFIRHLASIIIGLVAMGIAYRIPPEHLRRSAYVLGIMSVIASILVLVTSGFGSRWIKIGGFSYQPTETIKLAVIIWLGYFLTGQRVRGLLENFKSTLRPILYVVGGIAAVVVILQRDLGSMVVIAATAGLMMFVVRVPLRPLMLVFLASIVLVTLAIASTPYRRDRFATFLNPERDCEVEGYHACQALITVGSGGLVGLGVGNSVQAYGYLPATVSDSMYAVYAEKFGFIGSVLLLAVFAWLAHRLLIIARRSTAWEYRLIITGIFAWIVVQAVINIGAMLGLLPLKGITLPLVSYGGSSMVFVFMALGVALRISCYTSARAQNLEEGPNNTYENTFIGQRNRWSHNATSRRR